MNDRIEYAEKLLDWFQHKVELEVKSNGVPSDDEYFRAAALAVLLDIAASLEHIQRYGLPL